MKTRNQIKDKFENGDFPNQDDFNDVFETFFSRKEDNQIVLYAISNANLKKGAFTHLNTDELYLHANIIFGVPYKYIKWTISKEADVNVYYGSSIKVNTEEYLNGYYNVLVQAFDDSDGVLYSSDNENYINILIQEEPGNTSQVTAKVQNYSSDISTGSGTMAFLQGGVTKGTLSLSNGSSVDSLELDYGTYQVTTQYTFSGITRTKTNANYVVESLTQQLTVSLEYTYDLILNVKGNAPLQPAISGAYVQIGDEQANTNDEGNIEINGLRLNQNDLTVTKDYFQSHTETIEVDSDTITKNIVLGLAPEIKFFDFANRDTMFDENKIMIGYSWFPEPDDVYEGDTIVRYYVNDVPEATKSKEQHQDYKEHDIPINNADTIRVEINGFDVNNQPLDTKTIEISPEPEVFVAAYFKEDENGETTLNSTDSIDNVISLIISNIVNNEVSVNGLFIEYFEEAEVPMNIYLQDVFQDEDHAIYGQLSSNWGWFFVFIPNNIPNYNSVTPIGQYGEYLGDEVIKKTGITLQGTTYAVYLVRSSNEDDEIIGDSTLPMNLNFKIN